MKGRQKVTRTNHAARIYDHFKIFLMSFFQKAGPILLSSILLQTHPSYFSSNNNIHELHHIKRKHDYRVAFVAAVSKMLPMITNPLELFRLLRVRTEASEK